MPDHNHIKNSDRALFRDAVGAIRPVDRNRTESRRPRPRPVPRQSMAEQRAVLAEMADGDLDPADLETGDELIYRGPGLQERQFRKLRRGQFAVQAELDLHGLTVDAARQAVAEFLASCRILEQRCVRIIHGKGKGSHQRKPVIKTRLSRWLRQRSEVLAFCSARPVDGGTGAVYVLLKGGKRGPHGAQTRQRRSR